MHPAQAIATPTPSFPPPGSVNPADYAAARHPSKPRPKLVPDPLNVGLGPHSRRCKVCHHPERALIEQDFLMWTNAAQIAVEYGIRDRSSIYRHAHATGLMDQRRNNWRNALERIIEHVDEVKPSAYCIVQALRTLCQLEGMNLESAPLYQPPEPRAAAERATRITHPRPPSRPAKSPKLNSNSPSFKSTPNSLKTNETPGVIPQQNPPFASAQNFPEFAPQVAPTRARGNLVYSAYHPKEGHTTCV